MKKYLLLVVLLLLVSMSVFAQGNVEILEKITSLEGTIELIQNPGGQPTVYLVQDDGTKIEILLPVGAVTQLQLRNRERIQIEGVFLGSTTQNRTQEKLFARLIVRNQERISIDDPIQLSVQERTQLRTYQEEQLQLQLRQNPSGGSSNNQMGNPDTGNSNGNTGTGGGKK
ncbi:hypothetical protein SpiGrapes_0020 [Sphaerochaeta pleomorpha str. Grapes]|uniref:DUF5666 domain-containing protein n=1 Tax=Sphaerochaeta pleomorpha (strain ATCC BAA-1885 / DSM 22778 / Grapes) TaxID=158190 RepID=G8QSI9_SPHPG|nr:hypothetical protein [Sphaerochaeta pleomorpha]AEV27888.1 hypothetical protein SpiGrapes_0020 [Sphaerochaeta pleomorpha str. Grapes]